MSGSDLPESPSFEFDAASFRKPGLSDVMDVGSAAAVIRRIIGLVLKHPLHFSSAVVTAILANVATVMLPRVLGEAVDRAHNVLAQGVGGAATGNAMWGIAGLLVLISAARGILTMLSGFQFEYIGQRIAYELRLTLFEKLQRLDFAFHDRVHSGELITRGMLDLEGVRQFVESGLQRVLSLTFLLSLGAVTMLMLDPLMGVLALSFVPFVLWRAFRTGIVLRLIWARLQQRMGLLTRTIEENLQGARVVRAFAAWAHELENYDADATEALRMANRRIFVRTRSVATMTLAFYLAIALVLYVGGQRIAAGQMTVGHLTGFLTFMLLLQAPVRQTMFVVNTFARAVSSGARLFEVLDQNPSVAETQTPLEFDDDPTLTFTGVGFRYDDREDKPWALRHIDLSVKPGQTLGVIGAPGSGKSTLAHLIPRFYDVSEGLIAIGRRDIRDLSLNELRRRVAIVAQDVFLFDASLADNIAYAVPEAALSAIEVAGRRAQLHDHVETLPQGYSDRTGERGHTLSGGQRQRLSIARAIIGDPDILILDDSTSAIDAATERTLRAELKAYAAGRVIVIMSHRIASLRHADEIIVLDEGQISERGSHTELVAQGGHYAHLFEIQTRDGKGPVMDNAAETISA